jgi:hypothetical protein
MHEARRLAVPTSRLRSALRRGHACAALALAAAGTLAAAADGDAASPALCTPAQRVIFHCSLGAKAVSLCADMKGEAIDALDFRHGEPGRIELSHVVHEADGRRFAATVSSVAPRMKVRQVWFSSGQLTYLLSQCVGGRCPRAAAYSVLRGGQVVSDQACRRPDERARFSSALARFGNDAAGSRSLTPLVVFRDVELGIEALYPPR